MATALQVTINGKTREVPDGATILQVLELLNVRRDAIAVEMNREIVPRGRHAEISLHNNDVLEIVSFVGGG